MRSRRGPILPGGRRISFAVAAVSLVTLAAAVTLSACGRRAVSQPLEFNHQLHVGELGAECTDCHLGALSAARATIPNIELCADCHEEAQGESAAEARLVEMIRDGVPIPWRKVYRVPEDVYFSHRRHAAIGEIACETCHGSVGEWTRPVTRPAVQMTMERCIACHEETGASNDCVWCHR